MQPLPSLSSRLRPLGRAAAVLALGCLWAACDRHSAAEVPESYGHGSSHQKSYTDHQTDSLKNSHSFSDTQGLEVNADGGPPAAPGQPTATPAHTPPGHFFPNGS